MLKVWGRPNSVNVQKVLWCIAEIGIEFERRDAGLEFGINDQDWFLRLNPNGKVPLLQDDDFALWESNSIVRYLCAKYDLGGLCPVSVARRADAERWMDWALSSLARSQAIAFWNLIRTPAAERNMDEVAKAVLETNAAFSILDQHLATRDYVAGTGLTMGDIPVGAIAHRWFSLEGIERLAWPNLTRWYQRLARRSAFQQHVMLPLS
jgi:glutathione S-transferase